MNETLLIYNAEVPIHISKKRILGAAFFGLVTSSFITASLNYTIPRIMEVAQKIEPEQALEKFNTSLFWGMLAYGAAVLIGAGAAGLFARKKGVLVGLLSHLVHILIFTVLLMIIIKAQNTSLIYGISGQLFLFIALLTAAGLSVLGGWLGNQLYDETYDYDLKKNKVTVFGIRWFHYFWLFPIIIYPFLTAFIYTIYGGILIFLADFYLAIHPSLWFNLGWWFYAIFLPMLIYGAIWFGISGFGKIFDTMQFGQIHIRGIKKLGVILLYGVIFPIIASLIAYIAIVITHNMPQPTQGDWKLGILLILIIPTISIIWGTISWIREYLIKRKEKKTVKKFVLRYNITKRFYQFADSSIVYDTRTLQPIRYDQYKFFGGEGSPGNGFPDIQVIKK